ncbi:hypothetical protein Pfo_031456 [Paulownia fortunei]|nr:hypothetical protein Pfo_031456 [Paulownia fortunei]
MSNDKIGAYVGTDPTAPSLHLGHLIPFMVLKRFQMLVGKQLSSLVAEQALLVIHVRQLNVNCCHQSNSLLMNKAYTAQVTKLFGTGDTQIVTITTGWWGNITSGIDLIHAIEGNEAKAFGLTIPLMTDATGKKFGKSEGNAIWLDAEKTSPYTFYQFWYNQSDADINELEKASQENPGAREAQRRLAQEVTKFVHGQAAVEEAERLSAALFSGDVADLSADEIADALVVLPSFEIEQAPKNIVDFLVDGKIESSKRQAREDVTNGAIRINGEQIKDLEAVIDPASHYDGQFVLVRRGKKKYSWCKVQ